MSVSGLSIRSIVDFESEALLTLFQRAAQGPIGRALFVAFLETVRTQHPQISRVELMCRADNGRALALYAQLGFVIEGRLSGRVKDPDGTLSDDLVLGLTL